MRALRLAFAVLCGLACWNVASAEEIGVPVVCHGRGSGPLADMTSRLRDWSIMAGCDEVGSMHEGLHGLHSQIRNGHGGRVNAVYLGHGMAVVLPEPTGFRTSSVIRGPVPYLALSYWENDPLYLLDELAAYTGGAVHGICSGDRSERTRCSYLFARQMLAQCRRLVSVCRQHGYSDTDRLQDVVEGGADVLADIGQILGETQ